MERIILIGHGSPKKDANNIELVAKMLHNALHPGCSDACVKAAYLQFVQPDIPTVIRQCAESGAKKIILHPYFLSAGMHVTKDLPEMIAEAKNNYPDVEFVFTEPLGVHEKLVQVVVERIQAAEKLLPEQIERKSFEIIADEVDLGGLLSEQVPVVQRVIHATADFDFRSSLLFHPDAISTGIAAIKAGKDILTDIEMIRTGITKRWLEPFGGRVICNINDEDVVKLSKESGRTRADIAVEKVLTQKNNIGIVAIGNAPTALLRTIEICASLSDRPLVVGVPVGFVKAVESKTLLASQQFPFITNIGRKGGTPVAVAIVNALLKMAGEREVINSNK